jgi:hypothetical protein
MSKMFKLRFRLVALVVLGLVLVAATYGFAAANTVPATEAGEGSKEITGYVVSAVVYTLNSTNPNTFDAVDFTLDEIATDVYAGIENVATTVEWSAKCTTSDSLSFSCDLTGISITVAESDDLHVASAQ